MTDVLICPIFVMQSIFWHKNEEVNFSLDNHEYIGLILNINLNHTASILL
jgi:hypothetical protein